MAAMCMPPALPLVMSAEVSLRQGQIAQSRGDEGVQAAVERAVVPAAGFVVIDVESA